MDYTKEDLKAFWDTVDIDNCRLAYSVKLAYDDNDGVMRLSNKDIVDVYKESSSFFTEGAFDAEKLVGSVRFYLLSGVRATCPLCKKELMPANDDTGRIMFFHHEEETDEYIELTNPDIVNYLPLAMKINDYPSKLTIKKAGVIEYECPICGSAVTVNDTGRCPHCESLIPSSLIGRMSYEANSHTVIPELGTNIPKDVFLDRIRTLMAFMFAEDFLLTNKLKKEEKEEE